MHVVDRGSGESFSDSSVAIDSRVRVLQMQRIEVEAQMREQRQRADHDDQRADQHRLAIASRKSSTGASCLKPGERLRPAV